MTLKFTVMPRDYQKELLPVAIDNIAREQPLRSFALIARDTDLTHGLWDLKFGVLARAIDRAAWWLEKKLGKPTNFPTIAYVGAGDVRYYALFVGAIKVGYKIMFPSLANPMDVMVKLVQTVQSRAVLYSKDSAVGFELARESGIHSMDVPDLEYFIQDAGCADSYSYKKSPMEFGSDPVCIFTTAGTTGFPKAHVCTHAHLAARQAAARPFSLAGRKGVTKSEADDKCRLIFGSMGYVSMLLGLIGPVFGGRLSILPPMQLSQPDYDTRLFVKLAKAADVDSVFVFPKLAMDIAKDVEALAIVSEMKHLSFGGGPLPEEVRSRLVARTQLNDCWSSTETGVIAFQEPDHDAPGCLVVECPDKLNLHFEQYIPGLYELCITKADHGIDVPFGPHQAVFDTFPEQELFRTGDLFSKHEHKAHHWQPEGRIDDTIVLSLGNSVNPGPTEQVCLSCTGVTAAIGFGQLKPSLGLLLELDQDVAGDPVRREGVVSDVRNALGRINACRQSFERVRPECVLVADRPLPRSAKGLVQRKRCIEMYRAEIDACWGAE